MIESFCFDGKEEGVTLLVFGAVHGNEIAGKLAINKLIDEINKKNITIKSGKLILVPVCNPLANEKDVRQIDENLNRVMKFHENPKTYEQKLANEICELIKECDVLLDLHSTHCVDDVAFAFCDYVKEYNSKLIDVLDVDYVLEDIRKKYGHMLKSGATSFWETQRGAWDFDSAGSLCHGWSTIPINIFHKYGKYVL